MTGIALSGNALKIIAAISMLIDHIGYILFSDVTVLRIIGRLAFPIFAFMIAEGCRYTRSKVRYLSFMAAFAVIVQCVYFAFTKSMYMNVFVTFSLSVLLIYSLKCNASKYVRILLFVTAAGAVYLLNLFVEIDYGFWGCMLPVFATIMAKNSDHVQRVALFSAGLLILSASVGGIQVYSLLSIPLLLLYSGKRGRLNMKYFFYVFYPAHLAVLYGINILIK